MIGDPIASAELPEYWCVELSTIVTDKNPGYAEPTEDVSYHEGLYLLLGYGGQRFSLGPLGEVVYGKNDELDLTLCHWERSDQVDAPLSEYPGAENWSLLLD